ncbi:MAG: hypothetical protein R6U58_01505 [Bacteroidales bacterium]
MNSAQFKQQRSEVIFAILIFTAIFANSCSAEDNHSENNVKIYGNNGGRHKTTRDAIENFVKNVLMSCASARFHRNTGN